MKRKLAVLVLMVMATAPMARADEASKRAKVQELIAEMHMDQLLVQMTEAMKTQTDQMLKQAPGMEALTPEKKKLMEEYEQESTKIIMDNMSWHSMEPEFIAIYMKTFTEDEIEGMVAFYKSPAGQAVLTKMPELMTASMQIAQRHVAEVQPKLQELQEKFMKEMSEPAPAAAKTAPGNRS
jgi:hypothetical protein